MTAVGNLVALFFSLLLLGALATALHSSAVTTKHAKEVYLDTARELELRNRLSAIVDDIDAHTFEILPQIHRGRILFANGSENRMMDISPNDDAISYVHLDTLKMLHVVSVAPNGSYTMLRACSRYGERLNKDDYNGFIGLFPGGFQEFGADVSAERGNPLCFKLSLTKRPGMLFIDKPELLAANVRYLIPFTSLYTLYLSKKHELRFLSHQGVKNIENQPLMNGVKSLRISLVPFMEGRFFTLNARFEFEAGMERTFSAATRLGRSPYFSFWLHEP